VERRPARPQAAPQLLARTDPLGKDHTLMWVTIAGAAFCLSAFIVLATRCGWRWAGFKDKTLWDWLSLLVIPAGLALVLFALDDAQSDREHDRTEAAVRRDAKVEQDRRRASLLSEYLQQMSGLILDHDLARAEPSAPVARLATTLTTTVVPRLDGRRKGQVLLFLDRAGLLKTAHPHMDLDGADFRNVDTRGLRFAESMMLRAVDLRGANFDRTVFDGPVDADGPGGAGPELRTTFSGSMLHGATFRHASMTARFEYSDLTSTDFSDADVRDSDFTTACVTGARFVDAVLVDVFLYRLQGDRVDLRRVTLEPGARSSPARIEFSRARTNGAFFHRFSIPPSWTSTNRNPVSC
jgi:uncharacterized protein YjbI with pentapeptide repeats